MFDILQRSDSCLAYYAAV